MNKYNETTIKLLSCGRQDCSDLHSYGPGARPYYIIHYIIKGAGYLEYDRKRYRVTAGQSFLTCPYIVNRYYPDSEDPWEYTWIDFTGKDAPLYLNDCLMNLQQPVCPAIPQDKILPLYARLNHLDIYQAQKREAHGLMLTILGLYADTFPASSRNKSRENDRLATAVTLIHSNYHFAWFNVEALCRMMHCNRVTLHRLFHNAMAVSPGSYLGTYRLEQAAKMLRMGISVKTVAVSCGYADQFYFSRVFKQWMGVAPSEYKGQDG